MIHASNTTTPVGVGLPLHNVAAIQAQARFFRAYALYGLVQEAPEQVDKLRNTTLPDTVSLQRIAEQECEEGMEDTHALFVVLFTDMQRLEGLLQACKFAPRDAADTYNLKLYRATRSLMGALLAVMLTPPVYDLYVAELLIDLGV